MDAAKPIVTPLPSTDRLCAFAVDGREFGFRVPTVGDTEKAARQYAMRCVISGIDLETAIFERENGGRTWFAARLEIGLLPRTARDGRMVDSGEKAPPDWISTVGKGDETRRVVDLDGVPLREFNAVCEYLQAQVFDQKKSDPPTSGEPAPSLPSV